MAAIKQYANNFQIDIMIITETHVQEGEKMEITIEGMAEISTSKREKGHGKGGVAIFVSHKIPRYEEYSQITKKEHEIEHCAAAVYPNHNSEDKIVIVGIYRPPEKRHPSYQAAFGRMLNMNR